MVDGGGDHLLQVGGLRDVGLHADSVAAGRLDPGDQRGRFLRMSDVVDDYVRALGGRGQDDGLADAAVPAGDDDRFSSSNMRRSPCRDSCFKR